MKTCDRKPSSATTADLTVDAHTQKNYEIREKDSAHNKSKPLLTAWSIVLEMRLGSFSPGRRTPEQR